MPNKNGRIFVLKSLQYMKVQDGERAVNRCFLFLFAVWHCRHIVLKELSPLLVILQGNMPIFLQYAHRSFTDFRQFVFRREPAGILPMFPDTRADIIPQ